MGNRARSFPLRKSPSDLPQECPLDLSSASPVGEITFPKEDMLRNENRFHDALMIQSTIKYFTVDQILVDNGSLAFIIFKKTVHGLK